MKVITEYKQRLLSAKKILVDVMKVKPGSAYDKWLAQERKKRGLVMEFWKYPLRVTMDMMLWKYPLTNPESQVD